MESVVIEGVKYIKANSLAREFGYTTDYVGQLCRSKKVEAQLIGRSWFVNPDSVENHKKTRYRSSMAVTKKTVKKQKDANDKKISTKTPVHTESFYTRAIDTSTIKYERDDNSLVPDLPVSKKTKDLPVELAEAEKVNIKSTGVGYQITTTELPKLKFKGSISVNSVEDKLGTLKKELTTKTISDSSVTPSNPKKDSTRSTDVIEKITNLPKNTKSESKKPKQLIGIKKSSVEPAAPRMVPLHVTAVEDHLSGRYLFVSLSTTLVALFLLVLATIGLENRTVVSTNGVYNDIIVDSDKLEALLFYVGK